LTSKSGLEGIRWRRSFAAAGMLQGLGYWDGLGNGLGSSLVTLDHLGVELTYLLTDAFCERFGCSVPVSFSDGSGGLLIEDGLGSVRFGLCLSNGA
jgi:hypothetical protein